MADMIKADYQESPIDVYQNNPFIEALPPLFEPEYVAEMFTCYPIIKESERELPVNVRYHLIKKLKDYTQPLPVHINLERTLSTMLRRGYLARNPLSKEFLQRIRVINEQLEISGEEASYSSKGNTFTTNAESVSIIGISGIGKTTATEKLLNMYPQVIYHQEYKGEPLNFTQIVWLKLDCPFDGSLKTFCQSFFKAVDDVLGSNYYRKFGTPRNSKGLMMIEMQRIAALHAIGVIAIDEMQHLINPKNDPDEMLNFLVTLENLIGVPLMLIGTYKAQKVFRKDLRQARRAGSEQSYQWDRMQKDDIGWKLFLETMWDFQWLKEYTPLTEELNNAIYEESQGITAIAKNLFILSQERVLGNRSEKLTKNVIKKTAKEDLYMVNDIIKAIRKNDWKAIAQYDDVYIDTESLIQNRYDSAEQTQRLNEITRNEEMVRDFKKTNILNNLTAELISTGIFDCLRDKDFQLITTESLKECGVSEDYAVIKRLAYKKADRLNDEKRELRGKQKSSREIKLEASDLRAILKQAAKQKKHVYELLKNSGYIFDPLKEFKSVR